MFIITVFFFCNYAWKAMLPRTVFHHYNEIQRPMLGRRESQLNALSTEWMCTTWQTSSFREILLFFECHFLMKMSHFLWYRSDMIWIWFLHAKSWSPLVFYYVFFILCNCWYSPYAEDWQSLFFTDDNNGKHFIFLHIMCLSWLSGLFTFDRIVFLSHSQWKNTF